MKRRRNDIIDLGQFLLFRSLFVGFCLSTTTSVYSIFDRLICKGRNYLVSCSSTPGARLMRFKSSFIRRTVEHRPSTFVRLWLCVAWSFPFRVLEFLSSCTMYSRRVWSVETKTINRKCCFMYLLRYSFGVSDARRGLISFQFSYYIFSFHFYLFFLSFPCSLVSVRFLSPTPLSVWHFQEVEFCDKNAAVAIPHPHPIHHQRHHFRLYALPHHDVCALCVGRVAESVRILLRGKVE